MKVAAISASQVPTTTANSIQVIKACQGISQLGHDVHLFVPRYGRSPDNVEFTSMYGLTPQFSIEWLPSRPAFHRYDLAFQAIRMALRWKADIAYGWLVQAGIFSLLAHLPVIIELHGPPEGRFGPALFRLFQRIPGKKRFLPITLALANQLHERFNFDPSDQQITQISPNAVALGCYTNLPEP